jgi:hypothetical protein
MGFVLTITGALALWIVLWSIGAKAIDAFMLTTLITLIGATVRVLLPHFPGNRK